MSRLDDTREAALKLLPPGRAFTRRLTSAVSDSLEGLSAEFSRMLDELEVLWRNSCPRDALEHLDVWETALGLPSTGATMTRQDRIIAKLRGRHDFSEAAANAFLGDVTLDVEHFEPFRVGQSRVGARVFGDAWMFVTRVRGPLSVSNAALLRSEFQRAHTYLLIDDAMDLETELGSDGSSGGLRLGLYWYLSSDTPENRAAAAAAIAELDGTTLAEESDSTTLTTQLSAALSLPGGGDFEVTWTNPTTIPAGQVLDVYDWFYGDLTFTSPQLACTISPDSEEARAALVDAIEALCWETAPLEPGQALTEAMVQQVAAALSLTVVISSLTPASFGPLETYDGVELVMDPLY
jgi:uncharacterized protein YmfQ (DUF2313 family)